MDYFFENPYPTLLTMDLIVSKILLMWLHSLSIILIRHIECVISFLDIHRCMIQYLSVVSSQWLHVSLLDSRCGILIRVRGVLLDQVRRPLYMKEWENKRKKIQRHTVVRLSVWVWAHVWVWNGVTGVLVKALLGADLQVNRNWSMVLMLSHSPGPLLCK